jgi:hypothetical protein
MIYKFWSIWIAGTGVASTQAKSGSVQLGLIRNPVESREQTPPALEGAFSHV